MENMLYEILILYSIPNLRAQWDYIKSYSINGAILKRRLYKLTIKNEIISNSMMLIWYIIVEKWKVRQSIGYFHVTLLNRCWNTCFLRLVTQKESEF